jgi:hypothetical protein
MREINPISWHGHLFVRFYSAFGGVPPHQIDLISYIAIILAAFVFFMSSSAVFIVLNLATIPLGIYVEPTWRANVRLHKLTVRGGIPIIAIATPIWLLIGAWQNWLTRGVALTLAPFLLTASLGFGLLACIVVCNKVRLKLPLLHLVRNEV